MAEEEVHGGVEARVQPDEQNDEQVAQHRGQIHPQKQGKEHALPLWPEGEPQDEELGHAALIFPLHAPLLSAVKERILKKHIFTTEADNNESFLLVNVSVCLHCPVPAKP